MHNFVELPRPVLEPIFGSAAQILHPALLQSAHPAEVVRDVILHTAVEPVDHGTEAGAFVQPDQRVQILGGNRPPGELRL